MQTYRLVEAEDMPISMFEAADDEEAAALGRAAVERSPLTSEVYAVQHWNQDGWTDVAAWVHPLPAADPAR